MCLFSDARYPQLFKGVRRRGSLYPPTLKRKESPADHGIVHSHFGRELDLKAGSRPDLADGGTAAVPRDLVGQPHARVPPWRDEAQLYRLWANPQADADPSTRRH
jgi:hypothetical protein